MLSIQSLQQIDWSSENINNIKKYITERIIPDNLNNRQRNTFVNRFQNNFMIKDDMLFYEPLKLAIIPSDDNNKAKRHKILEEMFKRPEAIGKGQNNFHQLILRNYLGINREEIIDFLKSKPEYQLFQKKTTVISKSLRPQYPFHYMAIDLIDMGEKSKNANRQYRYIFTAVDLFTNYSWLFPMKNKNAYHTLNCFKELLRYNLSLVYPNNNQLQEELYRTRQYQYPKCILSDQGSEFQGIFAKFLQTHNIRHKPNPSYTPQPNVEAVNGVVRNILRALFIRNKNKIWYNQLENVMKSKNTNHDNNTGMPANELLLNYLKDSQSTMSDKVKAKFRDKTQKIKDRYHKQRLKSRKYNKLVKDLKVGKKVRVRFANFQSAARNKIKVKNMKGLIVKFSPKVYIIEQVVNRPNHLPLYVLKTEDGNIIRNKKQSNETEGKKRMFKIADLQQINDDATSEKYMTFSEANRLNNINSDNDAGRDLYIEPELEEDADIDIVIEKVHREKKVISYTLDDWIHILEGKIVKVDLEDNGNVKPYIISQVYKGKPIGRKTFIMVDLFEESLLDESPETINNEMERMTLRDVLKDAKKFKAEWYNEKYDVMVDGSKANKSKKTKKIRRLPLRRSIRISKKLPTPSPTKPININMSPTNSKMMYSKTVTPNKNI